MHPSSGTYVSLSPSHKTLNDSQSHSETDIHELRVYTHLDSPRVLIRVHILRPPSTVTGRQGSLRPYGTVTRTGVSSTLPDRANETCECRKHLQASLDMSAHTYQLEQELQTQELLQVGIPRPESGGKV